ncbi:MAG: hypothetical protein IKV87_06750 [Methanobrevibacter sp.]|nr:hypothetical protein [Methanobrevibacter sp.]
MDIEKAIDLLKIYDSRFENANSKKKAKRQLQKHPKILKRIAKFTLNGVDIGDIPFMCYSHLSRAATELISDETVLVKLALNSNRNFCRLAAVENPNLKDEEVLYHVVLRDDYVTCCKRAIEKIEKEEYLIKIALSRKPAIVRITAIGKIRNQEILKEIALDESEIIDIRLTAIKNIFDDMFLNGIIESNANPVLKKEAVKNIKDQDLIVQIAKDKNLNETLRLIAIGKIADEDLLIYFSKNPNPRIRLAAISNPNLKDEDVLMDIVKYEKDSKISLNALEKINNQDFICDVALHARHYGFGPVDKINNKNVLHELIKNDDGIGKGRLEEISKLSRYRQLELLKENRK